MELMFLLRTAHSRTLKSINLSGGHPWSKTVLAKAIKNLLPLPMIQELVLPLEGKRKCLYIYIFFH